MLEKHRKITATFYYNKKKVQNKDCKIRQKRVCIVV